MVQLQVEHEHISSVIDLLNEEFFQCIIPPHELPSIEFRHISLFGKPASGKTTTALSLGTYIESILLNYRIHFVCCHGHALSTIMNSLPTLPDTTYLYIIIDDAEIHAPSRITRETLTQMFNHDYIRHILEEKGMKKGVVLLLYSTQRPQNLATQLRNADIIMFKAYTTTEPSEERLIVHYIGERGMWILKQLNKELLRTWRQELKGITLVAYEDKTELFYFPVQKPFNYFYIPFKMPKKADERRKLEKELKILKEIYSLLEKKKYKKHIYRDGRTIYYFERTEIPPVKISHYIRQIDRAFVRGKYVYSFKNPVTLKKHLESRIQTIEQELM